MPNPDPSLNERLHQALYPRDNVENGQYCPNLHEKGAKCEWSPLPDYLTYPGMGAVLEAMRARCWDYNLYGHASQACRCELFHFAKRGYGGADGDTLPQAVALTAVEALEGEAG